VHVEALRTDDELEDLAVGFNTMVDGLRERDKLRSTMGNYMTESVMDHLLDGKVELGGVSIPVTVLFTDIRSFTSISPCFAINGRRSSAITNRGVDHCREAAWLKTRDVNLLCHAKGV
jgi:hypothetical protein